MVYKRVRGWTSGRNLPVLNFAKYLPPPPPRGVQTSHGRSVLWLIATVPHTSTICHLTRLILGTNPHWKWAKLILNRSFSTHFSGFVIYVILIVGFDDKSMKKRQKMLVAIWKHYWYECKTLPLAFWAVILKTSSRFFCPSIISTVFLSSFSRILLVN